MKKILFSIAMLTIANLSISQVVFQSNLSSWGSGVPTDFFGTKTSLDSANCTEVTTGAMHGTSFANLTNSSSSHKRFTTKSITVTPGKSYEVKMWMAGTAGDVRIAYVEPVSGSYSAYNSYQSLSGTTPVTLTDTIVVATYSTVEFIISFRNTSALGIALDSVSITELAGPVVAPSYSTRSIYEIQYTTDASGDSPFEDSLVETTGIVTAAYTNGYWIQDSASAWNGIYVYDNSNTPVRGDKITIKGEVTEYYDLTEIVSVDTMIVVSSGNAVPAPVQVTSLSMKSEMYEGVLVQAKNAECVNPSAGFGEWDFSSVAGDTAVVNDLLYLFTPTLGTNYDVTGVINYNFDEFKLEPRDSLDVVESAVVSIEENALEFGLFPNPTTTILTISGLELDKAEIYSINGKLIESISLRTINNIDVSNLENGTYIIKVSSNNKVGVSRFIKQ